MLAELYEHELKVGGGKAVVADDRLREVLARLKFVVLVATATGGEWGESGDTFGVLGSTLWADRLSRVQGDGQGSPPLGPG